MSALVTSSECPLKAAGTSVVSGVYGAQLPEIDDPGAQAVRRLTVGTA
jgi:hypothetical protein